MCLYEGRRVTYGNKARSNLAKRLLRKNATITLVGHCTHLGKTELTLLLAEVTPDQMAQSGSLEHFFKHYGEFNGVTVDVLQFVNAVEASNVNPDEAFKALRKAMIRKVVDDSQRSNVAVLVNPAAKGCQAIASEFALASGAEKMR